jgi:hypothetical protein
MQPRIVPIIMPPVWSGSVFIIIALFSAGFFMNGKSILFPGPISGVSRSSEPINGFVSHADFEQNCSHCHAPIHCITDTKCQDCHKDIAIQRASSEGLHSLFPGSERCQNCHPEHQGRDVMITQFAFVNVDHEKLSNFSLDQHREDYDGNPLNCESCHSQSRFLKETMDCLTCHVKEDHDFMSEHIELYGSDCVGCHDGRDRYTGFDHEQVFLLDGDHKDLDCMDCHIEKVFKGTAAACSGCHQDPEVHLGVFGLDCKRCHTTQAWLPAYLTQHTFSINHGSDIDLECTTCHINNYADNTCYGCHDHQPDEMEQLHTDEGITDYENCAGCHPTGDEEKDKKLRDLDLDQPVP